MTPSLKKRFWKAAEAQECDGGFGIFLDGRQISTPAKAKLVVPSQALAQEIAAEWGAQDKEVRPETMPATRMANSAIDLVGKQFDAVADMIAEYGGSDLICYRAQSPEELIARQAEHWDPLVDWSGTTLGAGLKVTSGILPVDQDPRSLAALNRQVRDFDPFRLAALHDLVTLSGSLVIGLAVAANHLTPAKGWSISRIDENYQRELWGADEEAEAAAQRKESEFIFAHKFLELVR